MHTVHITAEFSPFAKAGGLGEAVAGLCHELNRQGVHIEIILPRYALISSNLLSEFQRDPTPFPVQFGSHHAHATTLSGTLDGCQIHLIDIAAPDAPFQREKIYGYPDDLFRFLLFSRAALEWLKRKEKVFDVLHLHDWHTAACIPLAREVFHLPVKKTVFTLHSVEYQGPCSSQDLEKIGLFHKHGPLLALGAQEADQVTTVSPTYAKEILTPQFGFGIDPIFRSLKPKPKGILNGIDESTWNPQADPHLPLSYGKGDSNKKIASGKSSAKEAVHREFGLSLSHLPWVGSITRLAEQKGLDLLEEGIDQTVLQGGSFFLLGSPQTPEIGKRFEQIKQKYEKNPQVCLSFIFQEKLAHLLYAALDFFLIPSLYEPCGLAQMMAMRYGTVPLARQVGGLKDTVFDCESGLVSAEKRNGFLFSSPKKEEVGKLMTRAFQVYRTDTPLFEKLILRGIESDFSWKKSALAYQKIYKSSRQGLDIAPVRPKVVND